MNTLKNEESVLNQTGQEYNNEEQKCSNAQMLTKRDEQKQAKELKDFLVPNIQCYKCSLPFSVQQILNQALDQENDCAFLSTLSILTGFGAMMPNVSFKVKDNEVIYPFLMAIAIGSAAGGKSTIKIGYRLFRIHANRIMEELTPMVKQSKTEHDKWKKCTNKCKEDDCGCGDEPEELSMPQLIISATISQSKLIDALTKNQSYGTMLFETELDNASQTNKQEYGNLSPTLRKIYEFEPISTHSHSRGDISVEQPKMAVLMSGTPDQIYRFLINKEDGCLSRCLFYHIPYHQYKGIADFDDTNVHTDTFWKNMDPQIREMSRYFEEHTLRLTLDREGRQLFDDYFRAREEALLVYNNDAYISSTRRMRGILLRLAMVITAIEAYEARSTEKTYPISHDTARLVLSWADFLLAQSYQTCDMLPDKEVSSSEGRSAFKKVLFDRLPCSFKLEVAWGFVDNSERGHYSFSTLRRDIDRWEKLNLIKKVKHGYYEKVDCQEKTITVTIPEQSTKEQKVTSTSSQESMFSDVPLPSEKFLNNLPPEWDEVATTPKRKPEEKKEENLEDEDLPF